MTDKLESSGSEEVAKPSKKKTTKKTTKKNTKRTPRKTKVDKILDQGKPLVDYKSKDTDVTVTSRYDRRKVANSLTEYQENFCVAYALLTDFDAMAALESSGYTFNMDYEGDNKRNKKKAAAQLLRNPKVRQRIADLSADRENEIIVDKMFVRNGLKYLAKNASTENAQIKAYELLGKDMGMFVNQEKLTIGEDPAEIIKKSFEKRILKLHKPDENEEEDHDGEQRKVS